jgi:hypothetical protein
VSAARRLGRGDARSNSNFAATSAAQPHTKMALIQSVYAQVAVRGAEFVSLRLTP